MKIVRDKRLEGGGRRGAAGVAREKRMEEDEGVGRGVREVGRGRPRTRRIIARVILPRCAGSPFPSLSFRLALLPRAFCLALMRTYVRTYVRTRELASACERSPSVRRSRSRAGGGRGGREPRG